jgi:hypothetical protein
MTMWNNKAFTENELSRFGKIAVIFFVILLIFITIQNLTKREVSHPYAFIVILAGFALFLISKLSLFIKGTWINFGTKNLSENMANLYRLGYWIMAIGLILTFIN